MQTNVLDFIHSGRGLGSLPELVDLFSEKAANLGFHAWAYQVLDKPAADNSLVYACTYSKCWVDQYISNNYSTLDPVAQRGQEQEDLFIWSDLAAPELLNPSQRGFMEEARAGGLADGVGLAVHGRGGPQALLTMATESARDLGDIVSERGDDLRLLGLAFHNFARGYVLEKEMTRHNPFRPRERECLTWLAGGKTYWETSQILNISESVVKFHMKNVRQKLGVHTTREAMVLAIQKGYIAP